MARRKKEKVVEVLRVTPPRFAVMQVTVKNITGSPLVINAFTKQKEGDMVKSQEEGQSNSRNKKNRPPKDFDAVYEHSRYFDLNEGWDGANADTFRNALISAMTLVNFKMTQGRKSVFIIPEGLSEEGINLVRIHGEPRKFKRYVKLPSGKTDIAIRPRWDQWSVSLKIKFDLDQFKVTDIVNLLNRAGLQCGVGAGRPGSKLSAGCGWGMFEIDTSKPVSCSEIKLPTFEIKDLMVAA